jgi:BirA family biotin operon repressor/biotin-[acetyl-CoA-carboxylase] ligase
LESAIADVIFLGNEGKIPLSGLASLTRATPDQAKRALGELKKIGYPLRLSRAGIVERLPLRPIDVQKLKAELTTERIGRRIEWRLHVSSTQDELKKLEDEAEDGTVLLAETQYTGRGRLSRSWFSPTGGIWMSLLLKPTWSTSHQILTLAFAAAVTRAVYNVTKISSLIKWPNDLMIRSRKVAGMLAEATYEGNKLHHLIVGIGVNANINTMRFPGAIRRTSTSLSHELSRDIDRNLLTRRIIEEMDHSYRRFESGHTAELLEEARRLCSTLGRKVRVTTTEGRFMCEALDLGDDGQLMARLNSGAVIPLYAADVAHLR